MFETRVIKPLADPKFDINLRWIDCMDRMQMTSEVSTVCLRQKVNSQRGIKFKGKGITVNSKNSLTPTLCDEYTTLIFIIYIFYQWHVLVPAFCLRP